MIATRLARAEDVPILYRMLRESAIEQSGESKLCVDRENLLHDGFELQPPRFRCLLAECDEQVSGLAVFFSVYSTWISRAALYLEDLYVAPDFRRRGVARALMRELAVIGEAEGCGFIRWLVLRENHPAIRFYEALGAELATDWPSMMITGEALAALAKSGAATR